MRLKYFLGEKGDCPPGFYYCSKRGKCMPEQDRRSSKSGIVEEVTQDEIKAFESRWKSKLKSYGLTNFEFSKHAGKLRLNDPRNSPPIKVEELDYVLDGFLRKMGSQFKKDIENVKNHTAKKRGINKNKIPDNNLEFTIKSASNKINFTIVLKQDFKTKGTAMILPATIMRKKGWKTIKGEEIVVERREIDMKLMKYLGETVDKKLFALGREVNANLPIESGLKPSKDQLKTAAKKLGITASKARKAFDEFTWGE